VAQASFRCEEIASNRRQSNYRPPPPQPAPSPLRLPHPPGVLKNSSFSRTPLQRRWRRCRRVTRLSRRFSSSEAIRGRFSFTLEGLTGYLRTCCVYNCVCVCVFVCVCAPAYLRPYAAYGICRICIYAYLCPVLTRVSCTSRVCVYASRVCLYASRACLYPSRVCLYASLVCMHHDMSHRYTYMSHRCTYMPHRCT
jgi:hypothetical protein